MGIFRINYGVILFWSLFSFSGAGICDLAQESSNKLGDLRVERNNVLLFDLSSVIKGGASFRYEREILPFLNITVPLDLRVLAISVLPEQALAGIRAFNWGAIPNLSISTGVGVKLHVCGWYVEPSLVAGWAWFDYPRGISIPRHVAMLESRIMFGYQTWTSFGMMVGLGVGGVARFFVPKYAASSVFLPEFNLLLGYAW